MAGHDINQEMKKGENRKEGIKARMILKNRGNNIGFIAG